MGTDYQIQYQLWTLFDILWNLRSLHSNHQRELYASSELLLQTGIDWNPILHRSSVGSFDFAVMATELEILGTCLNDIQHFYGSWSSNHNVVSEEDFQLM